jgi:histidinol-phosphatase (PHP family)
LDIKENFHTHTYRCKHATGDVADYVQAAVDKGLDLIGISDHTALPDNRWEYIRMAFDELDGYINAIDSAILDFPQIKVLKSLECEYADEYQSFYRDTLLGDKNFDYLIGAAHFVPYDNDWQSSHKLEAKHILAYGEYFVKSMESGLFAFMAHPDVFGYNYPYWDDNCISCAKDIFAAAETLKVPLEINGLGLRKDKVETPDGLRPPYPLVPFWEIAQDYSIEVICNSDAHRPIDIIANINDAKDIATKNNLKYTDTSVLINQKYLNKY